MRALPCSPRGLALLALVVSFLTFISFSHVQYSDYLPQSPVAVPIQDTAEVQADAAIPVDSSQPHGAPSLDVSYLASTYEVSETVLRELLEAPTSDSIRDFLHSLSSFGHDFNVFKAQKLKSEFADQHPPDAGEPVPTEDKKVEEPPPPPPPPAPEHQTPSFQEIDPNLPKDFKWDNNFYINNGISSLRDEAHLEPEAYRPYPDYNSPEWKSIWRGEYSPCRGARGKLLNESDEDIVKAFPMLPGGFPNVSLGDAAATRTDLNHCFDRYQRYGPYGFGRGHFGAVDGWQRPRHMPDWSVVPWAELQDQCVAANSERYLPSTRHPVDLRTGKKMPSQLPSLPPPEQDAGPVYHQRIAVLLRTTHDYRYTENDLQSIRAMITELALLSGGEYQVFNLVQVKDEHLDIFGSPQTYDSVLLSLPQELRSISTLWNEQIFKEWYPGVGEWDGEMHPYMPLQWFAIRHPEFDHIWNWEMDVRFTGNYYEFLEGVATYAKYIPRKHMWERNQRFYVPSSHNDSSYDWFLVDTDETVNTATEAHGHQSVWGAHPYDNSAQRPIGPAPPHTLDADPFQWGAGEAADLITLQPIFDPVETSWEFRNDIWNFIPGVRPSTPGGEPTGAEYLHTTLYPQIPRRASLGRTLRLSRRQLLAMHLENLAGRTLHADMWPATAALHHGLKAVYAPAPVWTSRVWSGAQLDGIFNADRGQAARWGTTRGSVYDADRIHNLHDGLTWSASPDAAFPRALFRRWLGWTSTARDSVAGIGGEMWEQKGLRFKLAESDDGRADKDGLLLVGGKGRMCLPPMLLHPVRDVYEAAEEKPEIPRAYG